MKTKKPCEILLTLPSLELSLQDQPHYLSGIQYRFKDQANLQETTTHQQPHHPSLNPVVHFWRPESSCVLLALQTSHAALYLTSSQLLSHSWGNNNAVMDRQTPIVRQHEYLRTPGYRWAFLFSERKSLGLSMDGCLCQIPFHNSDKEKAAHGRLWPFSFAQRKKKKKEKQQREEPTNATSSSLQHRVREAPTRHLEEKGCITSLRQHAVTSFVPVASSPHSMVNPAPSSCAISLAVMHSPDSAFRHWGNLSVLPPPLVLFLQVLFSQARGVGGKSGKQQQRANLYLLYKLTRWLRSWPLPTKPFTCQRAM